MKTVIAILIYGFSFSLVEAQNNPIIVELFTSQGCSSCPAADRNLAEIISEASEQGRPVSGLSFHVDYWNYIGWKDPYSNKEFTERQRNYAQIMNLHSIYTPQMIVNGSAQFVGSDKSESRKQLEKAAGEKPKYQLVISNLKVTDHDISLHYTIDKQPSGESLNIAVVERSVENFVPRGENKSRTLHHNNVVRKFMTIELSKSGVIKMETPSLAKDNRSVILYIQDSKFSVLASASAMF